MLRTTPTMAVLMTALVAAAPLAGATGYLVNVEAGWSITFGSNVFGGQGDTLDVGVANHQCSDEDDFIDVGVANREGDSACGAATQEGYVCDAEEGHDPFGDAFGVKLLDPQTHPHDPHCSDDGDTLDVGVLNAEGGNSHYDYYGDCYDPYYQEQYLYGGAKGDADDAVDVGALNRECGDDFDANDVGLLNCESYDRHDGIDGGVLDLETVGDEGDTFDVSLLNAEAGDGPDQNGLNLRPFSVTAGFCRLHLNDQWLPTIPRPRALDEVWVPGLP